jgi:hypothetical protein
MIEPFSRGGMSANPFGGEERLDRLNLMEYLGSGAPAEKVLYARIIQDAASNYLYAFLGKNGTSAEEFFSAWLYFFKVSSVDRVSWDHHRTIKHSYSLRGQKVRESRYLIDSELQSMCFDKHFEMSGLSTYMHIDKFKSGLKAKRRKILTDNWEQVQNYVSALYQHELNQIAEGQQVPLQVWGNELLEVLVDPPSPVHLAGVLYVPSKLKKFRPSKNRNTSKGNKAKVKAVAEGQQIFEGIL